MLHPVHRSWVGGHRDSHRTVVVIATAALLLGGVVAGCASTPRAVLNVPGSYTAVLGPTPDYPDGAAGAAVLMCLYEESAVHIWGNLGIIELSWQGTEYSERTGAGHLYTPVISPGCGVLTFTATCCTIPPSLTVHAERWPT